MLIMETIAKIRRRHLVKGESISAIARDLKLSRNTINKYLHTKEVSSYRRSRQPRPQLGEFQSMLEGWLETESHLPKFQRRTAKRLFEGLQEKGYQGAYDSIQRFVRQWKQQHAKGVGVTEAFIPLSFKAGDACQFDWSYEEVVLGGVVQKVKLAHFRLAYSRKMFVVAYLRETQEIVLDAHNRAFEFFGGVPQRVIYDNLKTVVEAVFVGKGRQFNRRFMAMANHYLFEPVACTPACGWEKGQVENQVGNVREWLFTPRPSCDTLEALNAWLETRCHELSYRKHPTEPCTIAECFEHEQGDLKAITEPFDGYVEDMVRVSSTCLVRVDRNNYSVPAHLAGKAVSIRLRADSVQIVIEKAIVATHQRCFGKDQMILNPWHYLPILEKKPGALRNGKPFQDWELPAPIQLVKERLLKQAKGDKAFVELLMMAGIAGIDSLEVACQLTIEQGTITGSIVLNELRRLLEPSRLSSIEVPESIQLKVNPIADCSRYDHLRENPHVFH
jgi:transposase